jgi:hypothetical protein
MPYLKYITAMLIKHSVSLDSVQIRIGDYAVVNDISVDDITNVRISVIGMSI